MSPNKLYLYHVYTYYHMRLLLLKTYFIDITAHTHLNSIIYNFVWNSFAIITLFLKDRNFTSCLLSKIVSMKYFV